MNVYSSNSTQTIDTNPLEAGETIYIKIYPYSQDSRMPNAAYEHDIKIKIDKIIQDNE